MVTPVNLQLAHWNLEHTAQQHTRDSAAASTQAGQQGEVLSAAEHRDLSVQQGDSSSAEEQITRKKRREEQEKKDGRRRKRGAKKAVETGLEEQRAEPSLVDTGKFDLYA